MATSLLRPSVRMAALLTTATGVSYTAYHLSTNKEVQQQATSRLSMNRTAYAESPINTTSEAKATLTKLPWKGFTELTLQSTEQVSPNVKRLTFSLPTETTITGLSPVTSLLSQHTPADAFIPIPVFRPYTPISSPNEPGKLTFLIKKYPNGKASTKMHSLVPGDTMKFRPIPEYQYSPNAHQEMLLIAGGSGITPVFQLVNHILDNPDDKTKLTLIYANNTEDDILLRKEFEDLETKFGKDRFQKVFTVSNSKNAAGSALPSDNGVEQGYVTKALIGKVWSMNKDNNQKVLVSGPPAMTESLAGKKGLAGWTQGSLGGILADLGYKSDDVYKF